MCACIVWGVHVGTCVHVGMDVLWTVWGVCAPCGGVCCGLGRCARVHGVYPPCSSQVRVPPVPLQGLACCFGICAVSHLDDTLAQLENFVRSDVFRKSMGIFNIFKVQKSG